MSDINKKIFTSDNDLYEYIKKEIDMYEYLGVPENQNFCCVLPSHDDEHPSARIYIDKETGDYLYHCFGCGKTRNIISLTEELSGKCRREAINFIKAVYDLEVEKSEFVKEQEELLTAAIRYLNDPDFLKEHKNLNSLGGKRIADIKNILSYFLTHTSDNKQINGKPYWYASYGQLRGAINTNKDERVASTLTLGNITNLINKIADSDIPADDLDAINEICKDYNKHTNLYGVDEYNTNTLADADNIAKELIAHHFNMSNMNRETILRVFGKGMANRLYPQSIEENEKGTSHKSDEFTLEIVKAIFTLLEIQDYATYDDIVNELKPYHTVTSIKKQFQRSLDEILTTYDLQQIQTNAETKAKYDVDTKGHNKSYPKIIVRNENKEEE